MITINTDKCEHTRSLICLPGSGSAYFCDDCGIYTPWFAENFPKDTPVKLGKWKDYVLGKTHAYLREK